MALLLTPGAWAQEEPAPPADEIPAEATPPPEEPTTEAETPPAVDAAETPPDEEAPPAEPVEELTPPSEPPSYPEDDDPLAPPRRARRSYDADATGSFSEPPPPPSADRPYVQLRLKDGRTVEGYLVSESPEGFLVTLPTGETRFFDRLDIISSGGRKPAPTLTQKAVLLASLAWPGVGQIIYGAWAQQGGFFTRSALIVGIVLAVVGGVAVSVAVAGVALGLALPVSILGGTPFNPLTVAGVAALGLAFVVSALDAGARALLD